MKKISLNRILLIIIFILLIILLGSIRSCQRKQSNISSLQNTISILDSSYQKSVRVWKDKEKNTHYTIKQLELDKESLKLYTKELERKLGVKTKNLYTATTFSTNTKIEKELIVEILRDTIYTDTLQQYNFSFQDQWADIKGCVGDSVNCKDSISIHLVDSYEMVEYRKKHLFKQDEYFIDISNKNPYIQLSSLKSLKLQQTPKKIALGISFGVGYGTENIISKSPYPQLQVGISFIYLPFSLKF